MRHDARRRSCVVSLVWHDGYEHSAIQQSALVVARYDAAREALATTYPWVLQRLITVMNGSDEDPLPPSTAGYGFTIACAGTIPPLPPRACPVPGSGPRRPRTRASPQLQFGLDFTGGQASGQASLLEMAREEGIAGVVSIRPTRPHPETLEILAGAVVLVTFPGWVSITVPAKIFECARFDAWLLALAEPGSATDRPLRGVRADLVRPDDSATIAKAIRRRYLEYQSGIRSVRAVDDDRFSRRIQARIPLDSTDRLNSVRNDDPHRTRTSSARDAH